MSTGKRETNEVVFILTSDNSKESQAKWNHAVKLVTPQNEPKVIKQHPRDCVPTPLLFIFESREVQAYMNKWTCIHTHTHMNGASAC